MNRGNRRAGFPYQGFEMDTASRKSDCPSASFKMLFLLPHIPPSCKTGRNIEKILASADGGNLKPDFGNSENLKLAN